MFKIHSYLFGNLKSKLIYGVWALTLVKFISLTSYAGEGKISGYYIGEFYHVLTSHDDSYQGRNGFQYRRIYMNYDKKIDNSWAIRLRYEMNSPSFNSGTVGSTKITPYIKHGYLKWTNQDFATFLTHSLSHQ